MLIRFVKLYCHTYINVIYLHKKYYIMAIKRYIPRKTKVTDRRTEEGGYYEAECEICKREFYPVRSNAKYCSNLCAQRAHRIKPKKDIVKRGPNKIKTEVKPSNEQKATATFRIFKKQNDLIVFLKSKINYSHGSIGSLRAKIKALNIDETIILNKIGSMKLTRISAIRFKFTQQ